MGSSQSSIRLPVITREHWHEVPLPPTIRRKASHGQYKLFQNVLTNQLIEQYTVALQGSEEYDQYLKLFSWRQQEENIIASRYFQRLKDDTFCGSRISAQVYLQHAPYRLSDIHDIPLQESLYVLAASLAGFQKLFGVVGGFRPSEDMVGIDCEGRIKVWLNPNFSRHTLLSPHSPQEPSKHSETRMVMDVITLVEQNTAYEHWEVRLLSYFQQSKDLSFQSAQEKLEEYSKRYRIAIPKYFVSILRLLEEKVPSEEESRSETHDAFHQQPRPLPNATSVVHYINPALLSNPVISQTSIPSKEELRSLTRIEQEPLEGETKDGTVTLRSIHSPTQPTLPRVNFNYSSRVDLSPRNMTQKQPEVQTPHFHLPLGKISEQSQEAKVRGTNRRVTYSNMQQDYQLDEQLAEDLVRYFNN